MPYRQVSRPNLAGAELVVHQTHYLASNAIRYVQQPLQVASEAHPDERVLFKGTRAIQAVQRILDHKERCGCELALILHT